MARPLLKARGLQRWAQGGHVATIPLYEFCCSEPTVFTIETKKIIKWRRVCKNIFKCFLKSMMHFMTFLVSTVTVVVSERNNS